MAFMATVLLPIAPRTTSRGRACVRADGHAGTYKDRNTREHHGAITAILASCQDRPSSPLDCPVRLHVDVYLPRPKRLSGKKYLQGPVRCMTKPDWDNVGKGVSDCLKAAGSGTVEKWYCSVPGFSKHLSSPCYVVSVTQIAEVEA